MAAATLTARGLRPLGDRAAATRAGILRALSVRLECTHWHQISVIALARDAGISPGTFYQYFEDIAEATTALADLFCRAGAGLPEHLAKIVALLDWEQSNLATPTEDDARDGQGEATE